MNARELHDWMEASNLFEPEARRLILNGLDMLARVEGSGDEIVLELRDQISPFLTLNGLPNSANTINAAAAAIAPQKKKRMVNLWDINDGGEPIVKPADWAPRDDTKWNKVGGPFEIEE